MLFVLFSHLILKQLCSHGWPGIDCLDLADLTLRDICQSLPLECWIYRCALLCHWIRHPIYMDTQVCSLKERKVIRMLRCTVHVARVHACREKMLSDSW